MTPFRFGVQLSNSSTAQGWRDMAVKLEDMGYSTLYIPDHFDDQFGPLVACTVAAEATTTLNVGTLVLDNDYRHPVVLAKEIATLDVMSEGRFEFGIGAGWMRTDYESSGIDYDEPGIRVNRLEEGLEIFRQLFHDGTATFQGDHYNVTNAVQTPMPVTPGGPPLVLGGGAKRVLTLAGRVADIVSVVPSLRAGVVGPEVAALAVPSKYDERASWIEAGSSNREIKPERQVWTTFAAVTENTTEIIEQFSALFGISTDDVAQTPIGVVGSVNSIVEQLTERRERWGFSYIVIHEAEIDAFGPVVAALNGH